MSLLGVFVDNHDFPRFLSLQNDTALLSNALAYVVFGQVRLSNPTVQSLLFLF
jgi:hypothetical protein